MKILIADDEPLARERLIRLLQELDIHLSQITEAENGLQVLDLCEKQPFDLLLLDIRMPEIEGMAVAKKLHKKPPTPAIIFITAYSEYAVEAFGVEALDYLLKPVRKARLEEALKKIPKINPKKQFIQIHERGNIKQLNIQKILYFKAEQKYVTVYTQEREYLIEESLKSLEKRFLTDFIRIHRNALVAKKAIRGIEKNTKGHFCIRLKSVDVLLDISRRHLATIRQYLKTS